MSTPAPVIAARFRRSCRQASRQRPREGRSLSESGSSIGIARIDNRVQHVDDQMTSTNSNANSSNAGGLLSGAIVTETVFAYPGIGLLLINSIGNRDYPVVQPRTIEAGTGSQEAERGPYSDVPSSACWESCSAGPCGAIMGARPPVWNGQLRSRFFRPGPVRGADLTQRWRTGCLSRTPHRRCSGPRRRTMGWLVG